MAYPASTKTLQAWVAEVDQKAALLKSISQTQRAESLGSVLTMDSVRRFFDFLVGVNVFYAAAAAVPGIAAYLNTEKQGTVENPVAEFQAMQSAVVATLNWLRTNVPAGDFGGTSYKLAFNFPANNTSPSTALTFSAAQTAGYRTVLDALIATVG